MTEYVVWLASPIKDYHLAAIERDSSIVVANYLPNKREPKERDYVVQHRMVSHFELPDGTIKRVWVNHYLLMTYAFFRKNYKWSPRPGQTSHSTSVCEPTYV